LAGVEMARIKLAATVEDMKVDRLEVRTVNGSGNIAQMKLMGTGLSTDPVAPLTSGTAVFTFPSGSEIVVPAYGSKVLTVAVDTTNVGTIAAGKLGVVGFGTANAKGAGSGNIVQEVVSGTYQIAITQDAGGAADFTKGDIVYFTNTAASGTNTAPGFYMFTGVTTADNLDLVNTGITLNGEATITKFTAGDRVSTLPSVFTDNALLSLDTALAVGDVIFVHSVSTPALDGFYTVGTAAAATTNLTTGADVLGLGGAMATYTLVDTTTPATSDVITKVTNTSALVGNTMSFQEVEPIIAKDSASPSGSTSASSDQVVAMFDIQAAGSRDLSFTDFTVERGGSNSPAQYVTHLSLYNGSSKIAEVANTSIPAATSGAGGTSASTVIINTSTSATANHIGSISAAQYAKWKVGDTLTFIDTNSTPVVSTARIVTLPAYSDGVSVVFSGTITVTASKSVAIYDNRVHFNASQADTGDLALASQTITAGQTMTLTVRADTSSVKTGVTGGASANLTLSVPGTAGPLSVDTGTPNGLTWTYTALNTAGTAHTGSTADNYPVAANTLSY